jgi:hypothetical protein
MHPRCHDRCQIDHPEDEPDVGQVLLRETNPLNFGAGRMSFEAHLLLVQDRTSNQFPGVSAGTAYRMDIGLKPDNRAVLAARGDLASRNT